MEIENGALSRRVPQSVGRSNAVGKATGYKPEDSCSISLRRNVLELMKLPTEWASGTISLGVRWLNREVGH
jgi:hypothetical protein